MFFGSLRQVEIMCYLHPAIAKKALSLQLNSRKICPEFRPASFKTVFKGANTKFLWLILHTFDNIFWKSFFNLFRQV